MNEARRKLLLHFSLLVVIFGPILGILSARTFTAYTAKLVLKGEYAAYNFTPSWRKVLDARTKMIFFSIYFK